MQRKIVRYPLFWASKNFQKFQGVVAALQLTRYRVTTTPGNFRKLLDDANTILVSQNTMGRCILKFSQEQ